ncbi:MAG: DUF1573 domain-containing protein [Candidatus Omnitrophota bacterium]|nr:DUF1573 domain-containing protein [Candidatus Omnitrophota bacterium]
MKHRLLRLRNQSFVILFLYFSVVNCYAQQQNISETDTEKDTNENFSYVYDFGKVKEGRVLKHNFVLKNKSKKTLNIVNVNTSCGCTVSKVKQKVILPGKSTSIKVQFNCKGYSGPVSQHVYIHTDNSENPLLQFTVKAEVKT